MTPIEYHYTIYQGATLSLSIAVGAAFAGLTGRSKIVREFGCYTIAEPTVGTVDASGNLSLSLTAAQTADIARPIQAALHERSTFLGLHDIELIDGSVVHRVAQGRVFLSSEATR